MPNNKADQLLEADLQKSGLTADDIGAYVAQDVELAALGMKPHLYKTDDTLESPGYVIPYYSIEGRRVPFYRVKLFSPAPKSARYLQPKNTGSYVYYPKQFAELVAEVLKGRGRCKIGDKPGVIFITEGEKKAAKACKEGFPCCAVGGTYNWRTRTLLLPEMTQLSKTSTKGIVVKIPKNSNIAATSDGSAFYANGFNDLIKLLQLRKLQIVILFDTDYPLNIDVLKAAAEMAFEFRINGIPLSYIRSLQLPTTDKKMGLDDFLVQFDADALSMLLLRCLNAKIAFPQHPNIRSMINDYLSKPFLSRTEAKELSLITLADMDLNGSRMIDRSTSDPYFFDQRSRTLMRVSLMKHHSEPLHESNFGKFLYQNYDLGQADGKLISWLASGFTGEEPVDSVEPRSVLALMPDNQMAYQIDDGQYVVVSGDPKLPFRHCLNGENNLLFKAGQVEPIDPYELEVAFKKQLEWLATKPDYEEFYWVKALRKMNFCNDADADLLAVLYYVSPWLMRWKGTQLPIEILIGEPGSGKSSIYALRLQVLTGRSALRNQPTDIRDWYASILSQDGLHTIDNAHIMNKELRQRLSDEMCRIVTEPEPNIEMRRLFTTTDNFRVPVRTIFAVTAIQQPFQNADILQRSIVAELQAIGKNFESSWFEKMLGQFGGRVGWLAHELAVLHMFFKAVHEGKWNTKFRSSHRLANFEQVYQLMGQIMNSDDPMEVANSLSIKSQDQVNEYDWVMNGFKEFAAETYPSMRNNPSKSFTFRDMSSWAVAKESFASNHILTNARKLARYYKSHKYMIEKMTGIYEVGKKANMDNYRIQLTSD